MAGAAKVYIYDATGTVAGYIKLWHGRWYAVEYSGAEAWRRGSYPDRTQAIMAVLLPCDRPALEPSPGVLH